MAGLKGGVKARHHSLYMIWCWVLAGGGAALLGWVALLLRANRRLAAVNAEYAQVQLRLQLQLLHALHARAAPPQGRRAFRKSESM